MMAETEQKGNHGHLPIRDEATSDGSIRHDSGVSTSPHAH